MNDRFPVSNLQDLVIHTGIAMMKTFGKNDCFRTITFYPNGMIENGSMHLEYWENPNRVIEPFSILKINNKLFYVRIGSTMTFRQLLDFARDNCIDFIVELDPYKPINEDRAYQVK